MYGFGYTFQFSPIDTGVLLPADACFVLIKKLPEIFRQHGFQTNFLVIKQKKISSVQILPED
jgi:hypothetical protein